MSLGYHEALGSPEEVPLFLIDIRRTALCRAYSADKNWSVFLGRPPRLLKKYCNLYAAIRLSPRNNQNNGPTIPTQEDALQWNADTEMSTQAETRWTSISATLKEEILELFHEKPRQDLDIRTRSVMINQSNTTPNIELRV